MPKITLALFAILATACAVGSSPSTPPGSLKIAYGPCDVSSQCVSDCCVYIPLSVQLADPSLSGDNKRECGEADADAGQFCVAN